MSRPHVLCVMQLPPPVHGASMMNEQIASSSFLSSRFDIDILPLRFADSVADVGAIRARKLLTAAVVAVRLVAKLVRQRPDAVYFTLSPTGPAFYRDCGYLAILKLMRARAMLHLHGKGIAGETSTRWKRAVYRWALRDAHVIQLSPHLASDLADVCSEDSIDFIANGVADIAGDVPKHDHAGPPRVLYLSNLLEQKGPLVLLDALAALHEQGVEFEATFAGAPFEAACLERLTRGIEDAGLAAKVRYVGPVYGDAKCELLRSHDVFVLPTYYRNEAFPLVLLEAMQFGLAVVTTAEGGIPDIIEQGKTGVIVPSRDATALATALGKLLASRPERARLGGQARATYLDRFTLERFEQAVADVWARCLEQP